jgi:flagellar hook assembly protein FlgD
VLSHNVWRPDKSGPLHIGIKAPQSGRVTVRIFNMAAERVRTPFEAEVTAGITVDALWDGRNDQGEPCAAGVYAVSIQGAGIRRVLKVVLLK